ncbi:MAG: hypothetical protein R6X35_07300 [Candidatus Krumholzibacteriia bacterium]
MSRGHFEGAYATMWSRRRIALGSFLCALAVTVLFGCRAFDPEAVIVNNPPETYIIGAPAETSGGYYHFHVYWYGTDTDGTVERFVWALTDTSIQDRDTDDDEEDRNFDPADNISTLAIGHYTTRTDSIFDFAINQGPNLSYDMTLHMVAIDDRGAMDRTPARLHFISNALRNPVVQFWREDPDGSDNLVPFSDADTIGFGRPFTLHWGGYTENARGYPPELLAQNDTMGAIDGLQGFKYRLPDEPCDESVEDCWHPRRYDDARGDSVSYFGDVTELRFRNQDPATADLRYKELSAGIHELLVNTIDIAGVQVPSQRQRLRIVVNYDPESYILRNQSDPYFSYPNPKVYPYYRIFYPARFGSYVEEFAFSEFDTIPDRSYAVFKAIGKDDARDEKLYPEQGVGFQASFRAVGKWDGVSEWGFDAPFGAVHRTPEWQAPAESFSSDTVGFFVGPFRYDFTMRSVDEQGTRDNTPDRFRFWGNFPPCVQGVEVLGWLPGLFGFGEWETPTLTYTSPCYGADPGGDVLTAAVSALLPDERGLLQTGQRQVWVDVRNQQIVTDPPATPMHSEICYVYTYKLALAGRDTTLEPFSDRENRVMSWRYEIVSERDPFNTVADGAGRDNLDQVTYNFSHEDDAPIYVDEDGTWFLQIEVIIPQRLLLLGPTEFRNQLITTLGNADADIAFNLYTLQLGATRVQALARDVSTCEWQPRQSAYIYFAGARYVPDDFYGPRHCERPQEPGMYSVRLDAFPFESQVYSKNYTIRIRTVEGYFP